MIKKILALALSAMLLLGCSTSAKELSVVATGTSSPIPDGTQAALDIVQTPTSTAIPVPTIWDRTLPVKEGSPAYHPDLEVITAQNAKRIGEIGKWGLGYVKGIALSPDKATIAVSTSTGIYLYDRETLTQKEKIDLGVESDAERTIWCKYWYDNIDFSPDGNFLAIGENEIYIWDLNTNQLHTIIKPPSGSQRSNVSEVKYSKDGSRISVSRANNAEYPCNSDGRFEIYDTQNGNMLFQTTFRISDAKFEIYLSEENNIFFSTGYKLFKVNTVSGELLSESKTDPQETYDSPVRINTEQNDTWEIYSSNQKDSCIFSVNRQESSYPWMMDYSIDGMTAITLGRGSRDLNVWDFENCRKSKNFLFFPEPDRDVGFSPLGNYLITGSRTGSQYYVWNANNGSPLFPFEAKYLSFNFDESQLYALRDGKSSNSEFPFSFTLEVVNALNGETLYNRTDNGTIYSFSLSPTSNFLLIGDHLVDLSKDGKLIKGFNHANLYFSPDGKQVAHLDTLSKKTQAFLSFFDTGTGLPLGYLNNQIISYHDEDKYSSVNYMDSNFSPDWHYFAAVAPRKIIIWDIEEQKIVSEVKTVVDDRVFFSPNGRLLFTRVFANLESRIEIWDTETGQLLYGFKAPLGVWQSRGLALSPDGKLLAFLANDETVRILGIKIQAK